MAAVAGAALPLSRLFGRSPGGRIGRFGALVPDPNGVLDLPRGFSYRVLQRAGEIMSDGYVVPGSFDGMACFPGPRGTLVLMRNHENTWIPLTGPYRTGQSAPAEAFDPLGQGAVTRVVVDARDLRVRESNLVLAGTLRNCAGGVSPWGWLSCEETTEPSHGYVFLCRTDAERVQPADRIAAYGRFRHEAVCIDPETNTAYLTEDEPDGCLYRMAPETRERPFAGRLEALAIAGRPGADTSQELGVGQEVEVRWVSAGAPDPDDGTVRATARAGGAAIVKRGEGIWRDGDEVFFSSTTGGTAGCGQIFRLGIGRGGRADRLLLLSESTCTDVLDMPDNLTVSPSHEVFIAEDSVVGDQYLRVISRDGALFDFARNARSQSELAGVCFSPDGGTLFLNLYGDGLTLAVRGPFQV